VFPDLRIKEAWEIKSKVLESSRVEAESKKLNLDGGLKYQKVLVSGKLERVQTRLCPLDHLLQAMDNSKNVGII
jgi:hypothetical protein